jgi:hypothetical protein
VATLILVLVTLLGALPVYCFVARKTPDGVGSVGMIEQLFRGWAGKIVVLVLIGFAATDFVITKTLSAADAAAHLIGNPLYAGHVPEDGSAGCRCSRPAGGQFLGMAGRRHGHPAGRFIQ